MCDTLFHLARLATRPAVEPEHYGPTEPTRLRVGLASQVIVALVAVAVAISWSIQSATRANIQIHSSAIIFYGVAFPLAVLVTYAIVRFTAYHQTGLTMFVVVNLLFVGLGGFLRVYGEDEVAGLSLVNLALPVVLGDFVLNGRLAWVFRWVVLVTALVIRVVGSYTDLDEYMLQVTLFYLLIIVSVSFAAAYFREAQVLALDQVARANDALLTLGFEGVALCAGTATAEGDISDLRVRSYNGPFARIFCLKPNAAAFPLSQFMRDVVVLSESDVAPGRFLTSELVLEGRGVVRGEAFPCELVSLNFRDGTSAIAVRDVTDTRRVANLAAMHEATSLLNQRQSKFMANVSHELRTPLHSTTLALEVLSAAPELSHASKRCVDIAVESSNSLLALVNQILDISALEADRVELESVPFIVADVVDIIAEEQFQKAWAKGLQIGVYVPFHLNAVVYQSDPFRLLQIIRNLVSNAVKFTETGAVVVSVSVLSDTESSSRLRFDVQDTGRGIPPDQLEKVFERFHQTDASNTRNHEGVGLGLAISMGLVAKFEGEISVESEPGNGSVFWFTAVLPKAKDKQARRAIRPDKPPMFKPLHKDPLQVIVYNEVDLARLVTVARLNDFPSIKVTGTAGTLKELRHVLRSYKRERSACKTIIAIDARGATLEALHDLACGVDGVVVAGRVNVDECATLTSDMDGVAVLEIPACRVELSSIETRVSDALELTATNAAAASDDVGSDTTAGSGSGVGGGGESARSGASSSRSGTSGRSGRSGNAGNRSAERRRPRLVAISEDSGTGSARRGSLSAQGSAAVASLALDTDTDASDGESGEFDFYDDDDDVSELSDSEFDLSLSRPPNNVVHLSPVTAPMEPLDLSGMSTGAGTGGGGGGSGSVRSGVGGGGGGGAEPAPTIVLFAEDNTVNRIMTEAILRSEGYTVRSAENGRIAVDLFAAEPAAFAIVLLDIQMPVMDGITAANEIKTINDRSHLPPIPILGVTASAEAASSTGVHKIEDVMTGLVLKPFSRVQLLSALSAALANEPVRLQKSLHEASAMHSSQQRR